MTKTHGAVEFITNLLLDNFWGYMSQEEIMYFIQKEFDVSREPAWRAVQKFIEEKCGEDKEEYDFYVSYKPTSHKWRNGGSRVRKKHVFCRWR